MNPIDIKRARELFMEYHDEMMAESAWSGHEFAQDFLANLYTNVRSLLSYAFQGVPKNQNYDAMEVLCELGKDYGNLTTKTFSSGFFSESDKKIVGDMLEKEFLNTLDKAIDLMDRIYIKQTGHTLLEDTYPEEAKYDFTHLIAKACIEEDIKLYKKPNTDPFVPFIIDVLNNGNEFCAAEITYLSDLVRVSFKDLSDDPLTISCVGKKFIPYEEIHNALLEMKEFAASKLREEESEQYPEDFEESLPFEKE